MKSKLKNILLLFITFFKIGAFTFGGGYAMIPIIEREIVKKHKWLSGEDILDIIAISESTPGPIAINASTFVGYKVGGFLGALFSTLGVVLPSFTIICIISYVLNEFQSIKAVQFAFFGIRAGVLALVLKAFWSMYKKCPKNTVTYVLASSAFILSAFLGINVLLIIVLCGILGLITYNIKLKGNKL